MLLRYHVILHAAIYARREEQAKRRWCTNGSSVHIIMQSVRERLSAQTILRSNMVDNVKEGIRTIHISQLYYLTRYPPYEPASFGPR